MNLKELKEMINLMNENSLIELEIEKDGLRLRLKKTPNYENVATGPSVVMQRQQGGEIKNLDTPIAVESVASKTVEIKAPMVGTFYRAPAPDAAPYVDIGQTIEPGQVICIIEAMKLMNEIKSEIRGRIKDIVVENAEPVEFGQSLFIIEPL